MMFFFLPQTDRSPLYVAVENGQIDIANLLIAHGVNVNAKDRVSNL